MYKSLVRRSFLLCAAALSLFCGVRAHTEGARNKEDVFTTLLRRLDDRIHHTALACGSSLVFLKAPNTNLVSFGVLIDGGSAQEKLHQHGMTHLLSQILIQNVRSRLSSSVGEANGVAQTYFDRSALVCDARRETWKRGVESLVHVLKSDHITSHTLALQNQDPRVSGVLDWSSGGLGSFFPLNHPYAHAIAGYEEQLLSYSPEALKQFYGEHYTPSRFTFFIVGDLDWSEVRSQYCSVLKSFPKGAVASASSPAENQSPPFYSGFSSTKTEVRAPLPYAFYRFFWHCPGQESGESRTCELLAPFIQERLKKRINELEGLCVDISCSYVPAQLVSVFCITAVLQDEDSAGLYKTYIERELDLLMREGLSLTECRVARHEMALKIAHCLQDPVECLMYIRKIPGAGQNIREILAQYVQAATTLTPESSRVCIEKYLRPFMRGEHVFLPAGSGDEQHALKKIEHHLMSPIEEQLRELDIRDVIEFETPPHSEFESFTLPSGVSVVWRQETTSPLCVCGVVFNDFEKFKRLQACRGKEHAAAAWAEMVGSFEGESKERFSERCREQGVSFASGEGFCISSALKPWFGKAVAFLRQALIDSSYSYSSLRKYIQIQSDLVRSEAEAPAQIFSDYVANTVYAYKPWVISSGRSLERLKALTLSDVEYVASCMQTPSCITVVLCGDITQEEAYYYAQACTAGLANMASVSTDLVQELAGMACSSETVGVPGMPEGLHCFHERPAFGAADWGASQLVLFQLQKLVKTYSRQGGNQLGGEVVRDRDVAGYAGGVHVSLPFSSGDALAAGTAWRSILAGLADTSMDEHVLLQWKKEYMQDGASGVYRTTALSDMYVALSRILYSLPLEYEKIVEYAVANVTLNEVQKALEKYSTSEGWSLVTVVSPAK